MKGTKCSCENPRRGWVVTARRCNYSAFNGNRGFPPSFKKK